MGVSGRLKHTLTHSPRGVWPYEVEVVSPNLIIGAVLLLQKLPPSSPWTPLEVSGHREEIGQTARYQIPCQTATEW